MTIIKCKCGCGQEIEKYNKWGYERKYKNGHTMKGKTGFFKGKKLSEEHRKNVGKSLTSDKHGKWKGDKVGYRSLHNWLVKHMPKPKLCQQCQEREPNHVCNITGIYDRNFMNYAWFCVLCHNRYDFARRKIIRLLIQ